MASRLELHEEFCTLLGSRNAYFNSPESVKTNMKYPAIRYSRSGVDKKSANNQAYNLVNEYEVVYMDYDPDSSMPDTILTHFPMCSFVRAYPKDGLNHTIFKLYY